MSYHSMKPKKQPTVELVVPKHGLRKSFGLEHAERLLDMGEFLNGGWELPKDSNYYYDEENGLRVKSAKTNSAKAD